MYVRTRSIYGRPQHPSSNADSALHTRNSRIERKHIGASTVLDPEQMRLQAGRDARARAYLLLRPYISTGVRIDIEDERDPAPYWLVSSRRASALAAALSEERVVPSGATRDNNGGP